MPREPSALVVIPARAGSRRLPGKNNLLLLGRPMLAYTLDAVSQARRVADCVVITDDPVFKQTAERLGVPVVDEPPELAADTSPVFPAIALATQETEARVGRTFDEVVICDPNVPVRPPEIIDQVIEALVEHPASTWRSASSPVAGGIPTGPSAWRTMERPRFQGSRQNSPKSCRRGTSSPALLMRSAVRLCRRPTGTT